MVGTLQYLTMTRPDIAYSVHVVTQFTHFPCTTHLHAAERILRYLQGTLSFGLQLRPPSFHLVIVAYSDADWAGCKDSCRSTKDYVVFFGPNLISWRSEKQPTISKSSIEAECGGVTYTMTETHWLHYLLRRLDIVLRQSILVHCINISTTYIATYIAGQPCFT